MIDPRRTRLLRTSDVRGFRQALVALATEGAPLDARDRLLIVPTRAAGLLLTRGIEAAAVGAAGTSAAAVILPDVATSATLVSCLAERLPMARPALDAAAREVLLGVACRRVQAAGVQPPFRMRPGILAEILRFHEALHRHQGSVDIFERRVLEMLEPGAIDDRGAERLVRQTRFLVAAFREYDACCAAAGDDERGVRRRLLDEPAPRPYRHVVVAVGDRTFDPHGLYPADWDLLARLPGLQRLDVVTTDGRLAGAPHERIHHMLPGIDEVRWESASAAADPVLVAPPPPPAGEVTDAVTAYASRDREEEVADIGRRVKDAVRRALVPSLDRVAVVVNQPLPYVYLARDVLRAGGIPCQMFDALPLAAEPWSAALDLVFSATSAGFARGPAIALLRSPHFDFLGTPIAPGQDEAGDRGRAIPAERYTMADVAALDRVLAESGYGGEVSALDALVSRWRDEATPGGRLVRARRAAAVLLAVARALDPLRVEAPVADHLARLLGLLRAWARPAAGERSTHERQMRAQAAILGTISRLQQAYARFDPAPAAIDDVAALVRRWIGEQTFAPRSGSGGLHLLDAASAPFGDFDDIHLAGLVDGEWPTRPSRSIFYSSAVLHGLGWPAEAGVMDGARASFRDLLRLPARRLALSRFVLESDAVVAASPLLDDVDETLPVIHAPVPTRRVFVDEHLAASAVDPRWLAPGVAAWVAYRDELARTAGDRSSGMTAPPDPMPWSLTAIERYQDCPFRFFAGEILRLEEAPEDESALSPRARGRFVHEVFQHFFAAWDARGSRDIRPETMGEARRVFLDVATPLIEALPAADAAIERTRLFGSAIAAGVVDVVLGLEASRPPGVEDRWLEHRFEGPLVLRGGDGVALRGVADRVDLLHGRRLRVVDYKSGVAPHAKRALQAAVYALWAQQQLEARDGASWTIDEAGYVALGGSRHVVHVVKPGGSHETLDAVRSRVEALLDGIAAGAFPVRPHDPSLCGYCAYATVCRKDYVGDE